MDVITSEASLLFALFPSSNWSPSAFFDCTLISATASLIASLTTIHDISLFGRASLSFISSYKHDTMSTARPFEDTPTTQIDSFPRLSHAQRSRLVKSTRKLVKILGENPMPQVNRPSVIWSPWKKSRESNTAVLSSPILSTAKKLARAALDPLQVVHRRRPNVYNGDIYGIRSGPGEMNTPSGGNNRPSMLVLHAETSRDSEIDFHDLYVSSQFPSPAESSFSKRPPSVISTSASKSTLFLPSEWEKSNEEREISHRRRRLSKLARHLGERIPPDLILPRPRSATPNRGSQRRKRFLPVRTRPVLVLPIVPPLPAESPVSEQETTLSPSPPSSMLDVSPPAVEETVEVFESAGHAPDADPCPQFFHQHQRLHSRSSAPLLRERPTQLAINGYSGDIDPSDETGPLMVSPRRPESRLDFLLLRLRPTSPSSASNVALHRSERRQGWSGEWNVASMQDVISRLRDL